MEMLERWSVLEVSREEEGQRGEQRGALVCFCPSFRGTRAELSDQAACDCRRAWGIQSGHLPSTRRTERREQRAVGATPSQPGSPAQEVPPSPRGPQEMECASVAGMGAGSQAGKEISVGSFSWTLLWCPWELRCWGLCPDPHKPSTGYQGT